MLQVMFTETGVMQTILKAAAKSLLITSNRLTIALQEVGIYSPIHGCDTAFARKHFLNKRNRQEKKMT